MNTIDLSAHRDALDRELREILSIPEEAIASLYQVMHYHMGWCDQHFHPVEAHQGKRLRSILCLLACEAIGGDWQRALPAAAAIELIHNFSLIHGDIKDRSDTHRHRPTVWSLWGIAQGINTGDAMWTLARLAL
ncbi:MAG: polyprenyl synthetase family protein [Anaerolineae bacterium]|nr:polyprenyl synthetase family protein [Anaerolineae bacterium]